MCVCVCVKGGGRIAKPFNNCELTPKSAIQSEPFDVYFDFEFDIKDVVKLKNSKKSFGNLPGFKFDEFA